MKYFHKYLFIVAVALTGCSLGVDPVSHNSDIIAFEYSEEVKAKHKSSTRPDSLAMGDTLVTIMCPSCFDPPGDGEGGCTPTDLYG